MVGRPSDAAGGCSAEVSVEGCSPDVADFGGGSPAFVSIARVCVARIFGQQDLCLMCQRWLTRSPRSSFRGGPSAGAKLKRPGGLLADLTRWCWRPVSTGASIVSRDRPRIRRDRWVLKYSRFGRGSARLCGQSCFENPREVLGERLTLLHRFLADEGHRLFGDCLVRSRGQPRGQIIEVRSRSAM